MSDSSLVIQTLHNNNINLKRISELSELRYDNSEDINKINNSYLLLSDQNRQNYKIKIDNLIKYITSVIRNDHDHDYQRIINELTTNENGYGNSRIDVLENDIRDINEKIKDYKPSPVTPDIPPIPQQTMYFWFTDEDNFSKIIYNGNILGNADQYAINSDTKFPMIQGKSYNPYYLIPQKFNINYEDYVINQNLYLIIPDNNIQIVDTGILILPNSTELTSSGFTFNVVGFYNNKQQFLYKGINYVVVIVSDEINDGLILKRI